MPYKIGCLEFEWDPVKAASNVEKHAVDFDTAADIFDDPDLLVKGMILMVAYTVRGEDVCRIISARRANRRERAAYTLQTGARSQT